MTRTDILVSIRRFSDLGRTCSGTDFVFECVTLNIGIEKMTDTKRTECPSHITKKANERIKMCPFVTLTQKKKKANKSIIQRCYSTKWNCTKVLTRLKLELINQLFRFATGLNKSLYSRDSNNWRVISHREASKEVFFLACHIFALAHWTHQPRSFSELYSCDIASLDMCRAKMNTTVAFHAYFSHTFRTHFSRLFIGRREFYNSK